MIDRPARLLGLEPDDGVAGADSTAIFGPKNNSSLRDQAYDALRDAIISGRLAPGDRIKERDVAQQMDISTTPIKEALRRLEQDGLVVAWPRRGAVVSSMTLTAIEEIVEIRADLERFAARLVSKRPPPGFALALEFQLDLMRGLTENGPVEELVTANTQFHRLIREGSHNKFICRFVDALEPFDRSVRQQALADPSEARRGYGEHRAIRSAITTGDGTKAGRLMREHIMRSGRFVIARSKERPTSGEGGHLRERHLPSRRGGLERAAR